MPMCGLKATPVPELSPPLSVGRLGWISALQPSLRSWHVPSPALVFRCAQLRGRKMWALRPPQARLATSRISSRFKRAFSKACLAKRLAAEEMKTARLVTGNVMPTGTYGIQSPGEAPARRIQLRKAAALALSGHS